MHLAAAKLAFLVLLMARLLTTVKYLLVSRMLDRKAMISMCPPIGIWPLILLPAACTCPKEVFSTFVAARAN